MRVERIQRADSAIHAALWPGMRKASIPDYSAVVIHISKGPSALVLGPADGMTPQWDSTELALNRFKWMAESRTYKIYMPRDAFTDDQLDTLSDVLSGEEYELDPDELTKPSYEGYKVINDGQDKGFDIDDSLVSSDESVSSHSTPTLSTLISIPATNKRKRPVTDQASRSDDLHPSIADHLQQLEERLTQRMNAQCEEQVQRMLAESKDAILSEVDARLDARLAEIRADIANKPYEPREGGAADLDRELELKIDARILSLKDELREVVCDDVKARLISALGHGSSAS
ncbi:hypothetical protein BFW01_g9989 [Lasiodiplodia theobromae]|nr:hypothetical protein BFW01_g9989 [Lasiodiplodia theobromae]